MDFNTYSSLAKKTLSELDTRFLDELHMVLGIVTEAGELADAYKKHIAYGRELDRVNLIEEVGDIFWYLANLMDMLGVSQEEVLEINIKKLMKRYPNGFDSNDAINRDVEEERRILEESVNL